MRYGFVFLFACALGVVPLAGCSWDLGDWDWDYNPCEGVVCPDDGNECTEDVCVAYPRSCGRPVFNGTACTYDGVAGVCVAGECGENLCEGVVCDDGNACTDDHCDYVDGTCYVTEVWCDDRNVCTEGTCDPADGCIFTPVEDVTYCSEDLPASIGICKAGACVALPTDGCTNAEDLAVVCDPAFIEKVETCARSSPWATASCVIENTGVSVECASCYGAAARCVIDICAEVCAPGPDSQACKDCQAESGCFTLLANCTGDFESACSSIGAVRHALEVTP
jgi:hypothetical protein